MLVAIASIALVAGSAAAANYNNTRSNRSTIAGPDVTTLWSTATGVLLEVDDFDSDDDGFGDPVDNSITPPPPGDLPRFESSVFIPALNRSFLLRGVRPTNVPPAVSRDIATVSEELGGTALNRARVLHSGSLDAGGFGAESDADAFVSDLGTAVAFTSDRLDLTAAADSRLGFSFESLTELNLDLAPGQQGFAGVIIDWAFGRIEPSGQTVLSSDTFSAELDTLSGLNPSGTTTRSYALPTDSLTFQLDAGERYFLSVDIVNYRGSCPARRPPRRWRWPL